MKKDFWSIAQRLFPFLGLLVIVVFFTIISGDRMWTQRNILNIVNIMIPMCLGAAGMVFVSAQGSTDMSQGSLLALCGTMGGLASLSLGFWALVPAALLTGAIVGAFNGTMLAHFKVPSITVTLAMLIALRAIVSFITTGQAVFLSPRILFFNRMGVKITIAAVVLAIMWYLFEYTKAGFFSRCIGENQVVGQFSGISVKLFKILAFTLSGIMAGLVGVFTVCSIGGVSPTMGNFFELQVMTAMFVGGIPVTGGANARFYKIVVGSLMIAVLRNGLAISKVSAEMTGLIQGLILLTVVCLDIALRQKLIEKQMFAAPKTRESAA